MQLVYVATITDVSERVRYIVGVFSTPEKATQQVDRCIAAQPGNLLIGGIAPWYIDQPEPDRR